MLLNIFKTSFRNLLKHKTYSLINLGGLSIGFASTLLLILFIKYEFSYDNFHIQSDNIYRITTSAGTADRFFSIARSATPVGPELKRNFPHVKNYVRISHGISQLDVKHIVRYNDLNFQESNFFWADSSVFNIFTIKLIQGDKNTALVRPRTVVINVNIAKKYFNNNDPMGKLIKLNDSVNYEITGVMENLPDNSHFRFDFLASMTSLSEDPKSGFDQSNWFRFDFITYLLINSEYTHEDLLEIAKNDIPELIESTIGNNLRDLGATYELGFQKLNYIHLNSNLQFELMQNGNITNVYIFLTVAFVIIFLAIINYINLTTAKSIFRYKEIGIRKVVGAHKKQLIIQFLSESILLSFVSLIISLIIVNFALPFFNNLTSRTLIFTTLFDPQFMILILISTFIIGILSGSYPSLYLSSFNPIGIIKNTIKSRKILSIRNILVLTQFIIGVTFLISAVVINSQMKLLQNMELGINKDQILVLKLLDNTIKEKTEILKNEIIKISNVTNVTASSELVFEDYNFGVFVPEGNKQDEVVVYNIMSVDDNFFQTYGLEIQVGREFKINYPNTDKNSIIINEAAVKKLGWENPINKTFTGVASADPNIDPPKFTIVGVVKDFHFESLHKQIYPIVFGNFSNNFDNLSIQFNPTDLQNTINNIKIVWENIAPDYPFEYSFLDEKYYNLYQNEQNLERIIKIFTLLALFISAIGLYGLISFITIRRKKEIGIRKVLGAKLRQIIQLIFKDFFVIVLVANIISWPISFLIINDWLNIFSYKIDVEISVFLIAGIISMSIAFFSISFQSFKAAKENPSNSLRCE